MNIVFTQHALQRMQLRKITKQEIIDTIQAPELTKVKEGKYILKKNI
ncbi:MAG: hypothetical protein ACI9P9_000153 [Patescibacteria group bacterium]|jgi:hypothetical protein